ncbi:alternate-type signal peptide domain-containing protein [Microbacterium paludicola]|uniref:alternate-type signal peptide domain-containing protein n=1 Tax=Microbacterium paludicola TaxID=300019 RepID=UPI001642B5CA|nr:alternate-type signal peptide domain-containing protein [Microbacterium paludicola]
MHKTTKAVIAVGAATVLMLGGGGSLAYWQTSVSSSATTFQTGYMSMDTREREWSVNGAPVADLSGYTIVPGDVIVYEETIRVEGEGTNLHLAADVAFGEMTAVHYEHANEDKTAAMAGAIQPTYTLTGDNGATVYPTDEQDVFGVDLDTTIGDLHLTIVFAWPFGTPGSDGNDTMDAKVTLDATGITLRQVPEPLSEVN